MKLLYVYEERIPKDLRELVYSKINENKFDYMEMTYSEPEDIKIEKLKECELVLFAPGRHLNDEILSHCSHIKLMQLWSSGYDKFNIIGSKKYNIPVANNGGSNAISVAEHTMLLIMSVSKILPSSHVRTVTGNWAGNSHGMDMRLLYKKTLGLVGLGNIGKEVATRAKSFGMNVIYSEIKGPQRDFDNKIGSKYVTFEEVIESSDFLSLHLHHNSSTDKIIGKSEFKRAKNNLILINVSRAGLVDQDAFKQALYDKQIWGAGLDVYPCEPTLPNDPILNHPRVVATPHIAGSTYDTYLNALNRCMDNLVSVRDGNLPQFIVNK